MKHCRDGSDEVDCSIVSLPEGYRSSRHPPYSSINVTDDGVPVSSMSSSATDTSAVDDKLSILVDVTLLDFSEINVTKMKMKVDFILSLTWVDRRLKYSNLKDSFSMNTLTVNDMESLWRPEISFTNTEGNKVTLLDMNTEGYVLLNGGYSYNDITENRLVNLLIHHNQRNVRNTTLCN